MGASYRGRHQGATNTPPTPTTDDTDTDNLPGRHAPLDDLAAERGITWSADDLTVAQKKAELEAALEASDETA